MKEEAAEAAWSVRSEDLSDRTRRCTAYHRDHVASYAQVLRGWAESPEFRAVFIDALRQAPFDAFFWETPPVWRSTTGRPFEFVLEDSPALARRAADPAAFAREFAATHARTAVFQNLGGDAVLVAPCPGTADNVCAHLAAFARGAPAAQAHDFWRTVGATLEAYLGDRPIWLSTSGLGVAWLHVRLDARPKYYTHAPYRDGG